MLLSLLLSFCYFTPPEGWDFVPSDSPYVQAQFAGAAEGSFRPLLTFAVEKTSVSLKEYVQEVRSLHEGEPGVSWRDLGRFKVHAGEGRLTEITAPSPIGPIRQFQFLFLIDNVAYSLTGTAPQSYFSTVRPLFLDAIRSLSHVPDLVTSLTNETARGQFEDALRQLGDEISYEQYQDFILDRFASMGCHWQFLALLAGRKKIDSVQAKAQVQSEVTP